MGGDEGLLVSEHVKSTQAKKRRLRNVVKALRIVASCNLPRNRHKEWLQRDVGGDGMMKKSVGKMEE